MYFISDIHTSAVIKNPAILGAKLLYITTMISRYIIYGNAILTLFYTSFVFIAHKNVWCQKTEIFFQQHLIIILFKEKSMFIKNNT
jgi:hypothetical protein